MDDELKNLMKVWLVAITSLAYTYYVSSNISKGTLRLLSILPVIYLFTLLPLSLHTFHLGGPTVFFLVWLSNFKLILFSFDLGPLSSSIPKLPLSHFLLLASLPIKVNQDRATPNSQKSVLFGLKLLVLCVVICAYDYRESFHPWVLLVLYCANTYLALEVVLTLSAALVRVTMGVGLEPQSNEPYLSTSLQDFWGHRWNLTVSSILRDTVYNPVRRIIGRANWAKQVAMFATFLVSGLMHEVIYYYLTRAPPTWEVTCFFVLHGACTVAEVEVKKAVNGRFRLHRAVSGPLTALFLAATGSWLFFPQLLRSGAAEKAIGEYSILKNLIKSIFVSI